MQTDKPLISILMAIYEPRMDWLREQLESLNKQTYPNLSLYIRDDCSESVAIEDIEQCVQSCITRFPYMIKRNPKNMGSTRTFECLTQDAEGEYFAYCDQDDIWLPEKIKISYEKLRSEGAFLVCSDMYIIDAKGEKIASSIRQIRRHHRFCSGEGLAPGLLISNFVTGCTMLLNSRIAKKAIPFCPYMVHDHYLALYTATKGKLISIPEQLIYYRIHDSNQTLMMAGVHDKESYFQLRIHALLLRLNWLKTVFSSEKDLSGEIKEALLWAQAREQNFGGEYRAKREVWKYRRFSPLTSLFEVLFSGAPECFFMVFIELKRRNLV